MSAKPNDEMRARLEKFAEETHGCEECHHNVHGCCMVHDEHCDTDVLAFAASEVDRATAELQAENKVLRERLEPRGADPRFAEVEQCARAASVGNEDAEILMGELDRRAAQLDKATKRTAALETMIDDVRTHLFNATLDNDELVKKIEEVL